MALLSSSRVARESRDHQRLSACCPSRSRSITSCVRRGDVPARVRATDGPIAVDNFRWMMDFIILLGTIGRARARHRRQRSRRHDDGRDARAHPARVVGHDAARRARDLMIVFLGIELMSISVYALAGLNRRSERVGRGRLKYFLLGAFSTAFLLYGIALVYGATGSTGLHEIADAHRANDLTRARSC
jgi:NADH-quinone oxidoreductase subunit N